MKIGLLVPRYGADVVGGTELWLRTLCEHLVSMASWQAEVFTTCATSAVTWADELDPGDFELNGVTVHRHRSVSGRDGAYAPLDARIRSDPIGTPYGLARRFVELVGPVCPDAVDHAKSSDCDLVAITPYLFWPAVQGAPVLGRRAVFHPAAHDEAELHLPMMREVFTSVGGFAYNSHSERALVEHTYPVAHLPSSVIGIANDERPGDPDVARRVLGLGEDEPFVLCVGRVERGKGAHVLADMWSIYRSRMPSAPRLVMLGPVNEALPQRNGVVVAGRQSEAVKWGALRACELVVTPSAWESFSLVVTEAWLAGKAVVVNKRCGSTVEHCTRGKGGVWFDDYADFEATIDRLLADGELRARLASNGRSYALEAFSWETIVERYCELTERILLAR